ncbi:hypothetical protein [Streptomyces sp. NRRL F-525]|uniref:hypothetical protein n=1 Tax=Streptomyces sp. NRRL F-525 TaxID=1463861 RepID=UPI00131DE64F|nr:hypothetical protein [Streptomyces sp. NRRL F-525]
MQDWPVASVSASRRAARARASPTAWAIRSATADMAGKRLYRAANRWNNRQQTCIVGVGFAYAGSRCRYRYGMRVCTGGYGLHARGGATLGTTYFTWNNSTFTSRVRIRHENPHKRQWMKYGWRFAYMYLRAGGNPCHNKWEPRANWTDGGQPC